MCLDFKLYYKKLQLSKQYSAGTKNRYIDQWNRMKSSEMYSHLYGQWVYVKGGSDIKWGKESPIN